MKRRTIILIISFIISINQVFPCTTKVSEWTMLNFPPALYNLIYFTNDEPDQQLIQMHEKLKQSVEEANVNFKSVNVTQYQDEGERVLFEMTERKNNPIYTLYYKNRLFAQFKSPEELSSLIESPLRTTITKELKSGKLCVLLYLKSGNEKQDRNGADAIGKSLSGSIFKDIISVIHLTRDNTRERMFIKLLLKVEHDLEELKQPMLFGIFGRFRVLEPLVGKGITTENTNYLIQFLTADCSCIIKTQMPGVDMLYLNQWDDAKPALLNTIITE